MRIIIGFIGAAIGTLIVLKSEWIYRNFGSIRWAEEHLGSEGGSRLFYQLLGIAIIFLSFLHLTGMLEGLFLGVFGKLFNIPA